MKRGSENLREINITFPGLPLRYRKSNDPLTSNFTKFNIIIPFFLMDSIVVNLKREKCFNLNSGVRPS